MTHLSVPAAQLASLATVLAAISDSATPVVDPSQPDLFADEQAIDAFMDEREELKTQNAANRAVLASIVEFQNELQAKLNSIGIRFEAGERGVNLVLLDRDALHAAIPA